MGNLYKLGQGVGKVVSSKFSSAQKSFLTFNSNYNFAINSYHLRMVILTRGFVAELCVHA